MAKILNDKQKEFCKQFMNGPEGVRFNATRAYMKAYNCDEKSARRAASRMLTNVDIQAFLEKIRSRVEEHDIASLEKTVTELARIAYSDITEMLSFDDQGVRFKNSGELSKGVTSAIASVSSTKTIRQVNGEEEERIEVKAKTHGKVQALSLLAQFFGITTDFNQARACLKRYGLELNVDENSETGWRLDKVGASDSPDSSGEADKAVEEFFDICH